MKEVLLYLNKNVRKDIFHILLIFLGWKFLLVLTLLLSVMFLPLGATDRFLGGGIERYSPSPEVFAWANFDGEHYLSIAIFGYKSLEQAFFPVYPKLISLLSAPFSGDLYSAFTASVLSGLFISTIAFILALIIFWDLILLDYKKDVAFLAMLALLTFPTAFFFSSLYNESLFLVLTLASFYSARKGKWGWAGIFGMIASATRVFGILILPALIIEAYLQRAHPKKILGLMLIPLGLLGYMLYQLQTVGDPLAFYNLQTIVGQQHQQGIVLLPQVFVRYIKMLISFDVTNIMYLTLVLEFMIGILFFVLPIIGYLKKVRLSYLFFAAAGFLLPTFTGSFSSVPRYVLVLFPSFIVMGIILSKQKKIIRVAFLLISFIWLVIEASLFFRGYWVA